MDAALCEFALSEGGAVHELGAGGVASMNRGSRTRWSILEPTEEFFVYS